MTMTYDGADWSIPDDDFTEMFRLQNEKQYWKPEEVSLSGDLLDWKVMSKEQKEVYKKNLATLTMLDTWQGDLGMPAIQQHVVGHQRKALLNFMGMMENLVHARSYSHIFHSLISAEEKRELFEWIRQNKYLQKKASIIVWHYTAIQNDDDISLYKAMVASVYLESYLFYSGFYYPLHFYGQGELMQSGEIINLIIRDESIHGLYVGLLSQEIFNRQTAEVQAELQQFALNLLLELHENEMLYTEDVYGAIGLASDVKKFVRYNANKALMNLGFETHFDIEDVNPVVLNGLNTITKAHDFFSMKGTGYVIAIIEPIRDEDFYFN